MAFKSKYKGSEIEEIFDKVSTGKVGGGIEIVGSVDELDPDAPVGTMACVASETEVECEVFKSLTDAYHPTEEDRDLEFETIQPKLTRIPAIKIDEDELKIWFNAGAYEEWNFCVPEEEQAFPIWLSDTELTCPLDTIATLDSNGGVVIDQNVLNQINQIFYTGAYYTGNTYKVGAESIFLYSAPGTTTETSVQLYIKKSTWEPFKTGGMTVVDSYDKLDPEAAVGEMATVFVPEVGGEKSIKDLVPGDVITELIPTNNWDYEDNFTITCTNPQGENVTIDWYVSWDCNDFTMTTPNRTYCMAEYGEITSDWDEVKKYVESNPLTFVSVTDNIANIDSFLTVATASIGGTELYYKKEKSWTSVATDIIGLGNVMTVDSVKKLPKDAPNGSIASVGIPSTLKEDVIENISQGTRISKIGVSPASQSLSYFEVLLHDESGNAMQIEWDSEGEMITVTYNGDYRTVLEYNEIVDSDVTYVTKLLTDKVFTFQGITSGSASDINHVLKFTSGSEGKADLYYKNNGWKKLSSDLSTSIWKSSDTAVVFPKEYLQLVDYSGSIRLNNPDNLAMPEYLFEIKCNTSAPSSLTFYPGSGWDQINILWANEDAPVFEVGYTYVISIMNNMAVYASFKH